MKPTAESITKLRREAETAAAKAEAATAEGQDLTRRAERLAVLEDPAAEKVRAEGARYTEAGLKFAVEAERLAREARIAAAQLARDEAEEVRASAAKAARNAKTAAQAVADALEIFRAELARLATAAPRASGDCIRVPMPNVDSIRLNGWLAPELRGEGTSFNQRTYLEELALEFACVAAGLDKGALYSLEHAVWLADQALSEAKA